MENQEVALQIVVKMLETKVGLPLPTNSITPAQIGEFYQSILQAVREA